MIMRLNQELSSLNNWRFRCRNIKNTASRLSMVFEYSKEDEETEREREREKYFLIYFTITFQYKHIISFYTSYITCSPSNQCLNKLTPMLPNLLTHGNILTLIILTSPLNLMLVRTKHEIGTVLLKKRNWQAFSENISKLLLGRHMLHSKITSNHPFSDKMIINLNMFHSRMKHGIGR